MAPRESAHAGGRRRWGLIFTALSKAPREQGAEDTAQLLQESCGIQRVRGGACLQRKGQFYERKVFSGYMFPI